ncbi:Hypothetical protein CINCED_3A024386 [Cinara cedri]|uniref:Uncharacterized protein n=1 Tax=Cinara cedri TaxID=506608 RepID=A0A5E4M393_9HEMI|nr:Hypothetical protein CINCED_3A024386 [Cinara cedri]
MKPKSTETKGDSGPQNQNNENNNTKTKNNKPALGFLNRICGKKKNTKDKTGTTEIVEAKKSNPTKTIEGNENQNENIENINIEPSQIEEIQDEMRERGGPRVSPKKGQFELNKWVLIKHQIIGCIEL